MQSVLLLHGAIGAIDQLEIIEKELASSFIVHKLNFSSHGGFGVIDQPFSIQIFANDVLDYLNKNQIKSISLFGYSMGGYVALYVAKHHPARVQKIITLATKFTWNESTAAKETAMLQADKIEEKLPAFAISLQKRHAPHDWKTVLEKTAAMLTEMGKDNPLKKEDYKSITQPVLLLLGDKDKMVTFNETEAVCKALPNAKMSLLLDTPHPIEAVNTGLLIQKISSFLA